jgi:branched-chain amino acid transport system ATP-binding protein
LAPADTTAIAVDGLSVRYGKIQALREVSINVAEGEVVGLLGANGAGKTTLINAISGFLTPTAGTIRVRGNRLDGKPPHVMFRAGVVQVSQGRDLFTTMTVEENLILGAPAGNGATRTAARLGLVYEKFPRLMEFRRRRVRGLSGGEQQMLAIGRALMGEPRVLMLDEPSSGLAPRFVEEIAAIIFALKQTGATMLLVEQNLKLAASVTDRFYVLRGGAVVHQDKGTALAGGHTDFVRRHYL